MFYNIFIPNVNPNGKSEEDAFILLIENIIHEQLNQTSAYLLANDEISVGKINYLLIDSSPGAWFDEARIQAICSRYKNLDCQMIGDKPIKEGNEYMTLTKVREYCQASDDKSQRVSYFHSKGTFHPNPHNDVWRYFLLKAILHPDCLHPPPAPQESNLSETKTCNACGLQFHPIWNTFFPGNFWTAQCSMIEKLLDPEQYEKELRSIISKIYNSKQFEAYIYKWDTWSLGFGRMAAEFWVGSHPDLNPCDLSEEALITSWSKSFNVTSEFSFKYGARHPYDVPRHMMNRRMLPNVIQNETLRMQEYYLLPGLLLRWYALYKKFPPADSWVWKYYPDGTYWQKRVQEPAYYDFFAKIQDQSTHVEEWKMWNDSLVAEAHDKSANKFWIRDVKKFLAKSSSTSQR